MVTRTSATVTHSSWLPLCAPASLIHPEALEVSAGQEEQGNQAAGVESSGGLPTGPDMAIMLLGKAGFDVMVEGGVKEEPEAATQAAFLEALKDFMIQESRREDGEGSVAEELEVEEWLLQGLRFSPDERLDVKGMAERLGLEEDEEEEEEGGDDAGGSGDDDDDEGEGEDKDEGAA